MIETLQRLIEALRTELQQYGEMLALLDQQQEIVRLRGADDILHSISCIHAQSLLIDGARQHRRSFQSQLAQSLNRVEDSFAEMLPLLPEPYRPLIMALVQENNELLRRVRERAEQNHLQLRRSLELMQRFITTLAPSADSEPESLEAPVAYEAIA